MTVVDARGHRCPTPTLRLRRALEQARPGEDVELIADDPLARIDVPHFARESGHALIEIADQHGVMRFRLRKKGCADGECTRA
jgi:tRNA 2-thiouridine synthesizing protein A